MYAWIDLYLQKQIQTSASSIQIKPHVTLIHKCPFDVLSHRRFLQMKQILHFFDSMCKENDRK